jgi:hypothetical protein
MIFKFFTETTELQGVKYISPFGLQKGSVGCPFNIIHKNRNRYGNSYQPNRETLKNQWGAGAVPVNTGNGNGNMREGSHRVMGWR